MTADIEFPGIDAPEVTRTEVAKPAETSAVQPAIEKPTLQGLALAEFGDWRLAAKTATDTLTGVVHDLSTPTKIAEAKSLRWRLTGQPRADINKVEKALKSKLAGASKAVGAEAAAAVAAFDAAELLITPQINAAEEAIEAERKRKADAEASRKATHEANIAEIRGNLAAAQGLTAAEIAPAIDTLGVLINTFVADPWEEYATQALAVMGETREALQVLHDRTKAAEGAAAALAAQKAEQARIAAEQAEAQRRLDEQAAALRRQQEELAAQAKALADAKAAAEAAEAKRIADQQAAEALAESDRVEALAIENRKRLAAEQLHEAQHPQQVLKAEPATADATDRGTAATASPRVGAMGVGQAADAAPAGEHDMAPQYPPETDPFAELLAHLRAGIDGDRFPSHPKPTRAWWDELKSLIATAEGAQA